MSWPRFGYTCDQRRLMSCKYENIHQLLNSTKMFWVVRFALTESGEDPAVKPDKLTECQVLSVQTELRCFWASGSCLSWSNRKMCYYLFCMCERQTSLELTHLWVPLGSPNSGQHEDAVYSICSWDSCGLVLTLQHNSMPAVWQNNLNSKVNSLLSAAYTMTCSCMMHIIQ